MRTSDRLLAEFAHAHPKKIDLSLGRMHRLLKALGNPEQNLPPVIHVAGTNGKGSTIAFLSAMLAAAKKTHHRYHSPHLFTFHERILLNNQPITDETLTHYLELCRARNNESADTAITFFEITTAAAFAAFADTQFIGAPAEFLLLEVGLGGRLDATNVITPYLSAITAIDYDHQEFLGDTLSAIAHEKAGIIKPHTPIVCAPQHSEVATIIRARAEAQNAPLSLGNQDWQVMSEHISGQERLIYQDEQGLLDLPPPSLAGAHQYINAGVAIKLARLIGLDETAIATGLTQAQWSGRLQNITLPAYPNRQIWLDGAHNVAGARVLAQWLKERIKQPAKQSGHKKDVSMIVAMMGNKDCAAYFKEIAKYNPDTNITIHTCPLVGQAKEVIEGATADDLCRAAKGAGLTAFAHKDLAAALDASTSKEDDKENMLVISGSLYLMAQVLSLKSTL